MGGNMKSVVRRFAVVGAIGLTLGCSRNRAQTEIDPNAETRVVVDNQAFPDMTIYVLEGGRRVRLGLAGGNSKTTFTIPKYQVQTLTSIRFLADPIGSNRTPISESITVSPGDEVTLRIPPG
jgi:hypothetical protein